MVIITIQIHRSAAAMQIPQVASLKLPENSEIPLGSAVIPASVLLQGKPEVLISHNGDIYRLRITKNSKLILTK